MDVAASEGRRRTWSEKGASMRFTGRSGSRRAWSGGSLIPLAVCFLTMLGSLGCVTTVNEASRAHPNDPEYRDRLDEVGTIYESRDVQKIMGLYVGDTYSLSFDQTISFDSGATDHRGTLENLLQGVESLKVAWAPDVTVDRTSEHAWTTRHFVATAKLVTGEVREVSGWHSAIWSERDGKWLIEYEHFQGDTKLVSSPPASPVAAPAPLVAVPAVETFPDIFFDYDKWDIRADQLDSIGIVLAWLQKYPESTMTVEGHCDERGSTRYNINLGQRRADTTKAWLVAHGVAPERLRTISFGKSRPFEDGRSQEAWQSNRRSHFVVTKGPQRP